MPIADPAGLTPSFQFPDGSPLAWANTPGIREYMAIGVVIGEEIGQMSEIKEIVDAG